MFRWYFAAVTTVAFAFATDLRAAPTDPLALIPPEADLVLKVERPRQLVEAFTQLDALRQLQSFAPARELLESTTGRRVFQLLRYFERELGADWPALLDRIGGRGAVLAVKYGDYTGDFPAMLVLQGTDAGTVKAFFRLGLDIIEQQASSDDSPFRFERKMHRGADVIRLDGSAIVAQIDDLIIITSKPTILEKALDLRDRGGKSMIDHAGVIAAKKLLGTDPLAWLWYDFNPVKQLPGAKDLFAEPRNDVVLTVLFTGLLDVFRRTPSINAGLYASKDGMKLALRMPVGERGRGGDTIIHVPAASESGSLPLLEPPGVVFSHSFFFDFGALWDQRAKVLNADNASAFGELDGAASRLLPGTSVPKLFRGVGPHHRFVVLNHRPTDYRKTPSNKLPGFAFVSSVRDPDFGKSMEIFIRGGMLALRTQIETKLFTTEHQGVRIVGYRFPEDVEVPDDVDGLRFNFTPCFARMDGYFVTASTVEHCRTIIDEIRKQGTPVRSTSNMRMRLYAEGNADLLNITPDDLLTQIILDQAIPATEAKQQVQQLIGYLKQLGWVGIEYDWQPERFELSLQWHHGMKGAK